MSNVSEIQTECGRRDAKIYTYDEAVELSGHGRYQHLLLIACCVISNAVGQDMFGFSIVVAAAQCDLKLGVEETGLLASAPFTGVIFALPWGYYADTRGRRRALQLSTLVGFIFAATSCLAPTWQLMLLAKVLSSSFSAASFTLTVTILGESTSSAYRSHYLFIMNIFNLISEGLAFAISFFLLPLQFSFYIPFLDIYFRSWRLLTLVLALPLLIGGLIIVFLHESPKFLASRGKSEEALRVLKSIYAWNSGMGEYPVEHLLTTEDTALLKKTSFLNSVLKQTLPIFKPPLLWRTMQLSYLIGICCSTNNTFLMWYATIVDVFFKSLAGGWDSNRTFCERVFDDSNTTMSHSVLDDDYVCNDDISTQTIISGVFYGLFVCVVTLLVLRFASRRRLVLVSCLTVSMVSCLLVDLRQPQASLVFFMLLQISVVALSSLAGYCVELYPTAIRGLATGLTMMVGRLYSVAGVNLVGAVITTHCSVTFYAWSLFVFSGVMVSMFLPSDSAMKRQL